MTKSNSIPSLPFFSLKNKNTNKNNKNNKNKTEFMSSEHSSSTTDIQNSASPSPRSHRHRSPPTNGVAAAISRLYDSACFTDVEFIVGSNDAALIEEQSTSSSGGNHHNRETEGMLDDTSSDISAPEPPETIRAHRIILAARSIVFERMLFGYMKESQDKDQQIEIPDIAPSVFKAMLKWIYSDQVECGPENVMELFYAAKKYHLEPLIDDCVDFIVKEIDIENAAEFFSQGLKFSQEEIVSTSLRIFSKYLDKVSQTEGFLNLPQKDLIELVKDDRFGAKEVDIFSACLSWVDHYCRKTGKTDRRAVIDPILKHIRFPIMNNADVANVVDPANILEPQELISVYRCICGNSSSDIFPSNSRITLGPKYVFSASSDRTLKQWKISTGELIHTFHGPTDNVYCLAMYNDFLFGSGRDEMVSIWNISNREHVRRFKAHNGYVCKMNVCGDTLVTCSGDHSIRLWDLPSLCSSTNGGIAESTRVLRGHTQDVRCVASYGNTICSGSDDHSIRVWDMESGAQKHQLSGHTMKIFGLKVLEQGVFLSGSLDKTIRLWNINSDTDFSDIGCQIFTGHTEGVLSFTQLEDNQHQFLSGSKDNTAILWDVNHKTPLRVFSHHSGSVWSMSAISESVFFTGSTDCTIAKWDVRANSTQPVQVLRSHDSTVWDMLNC
eukprot:gb/GECH01010257.1/.p1 GENE.gb/GECH01010257.1/~~gb/GECH01010257.1/.p1  ORF type:complete len:667 (+),score=153.28 gb/GECH01010257.1/:1-2001(+)